MLLVAKLANTKGCKNPENNIETLAHGYLSESDQREISNKYEHERIQSFSELGLDAMCRQ